MSEQKKNGRRDLLRFAGLTTALTIADKFKMFFFIWIKLGF